MADVLYIIRHVPSSDAMTLRSMSVIRLLKSCGFSVDIMSTAMTSARSDIDDIRIGAANYLSPATLSINSKIKRHIEMATGRIASKEVCKYIDEFAPKMLFFYGGTSTLVSRVSQYAAARGVATLVDETDWFEPNYRMSPYNYIFYALSDHRIKKVSPSLDGQIAISPYFDNYFRRWGGNSFFLPPCVESIKNIDSSSGAPSVVYAGSLGEDKDIIVPFIEAMLLHAKERIAIGKREGVTLEVVGLSARDVCDQIGVKEEELAAAGVSCHGRIPHEKAVSIVEACSFGLLLRHPKLYARAGFSTKFVEYMSYGTAPICNEVGGAERLLEDGVDGFVLGVGETDVDSLLTLIRRLDELPKETVRSMGSSARAKAMELFLESHYEEDFRNFINSVLEGRKTANQSSRSRK